MANKTFIVAYLIRARDQYSKVAAKVAQTTERMKKKIKEAGGAFTNFSEKMRKAGKVLSVGATIPIAFLANSLKNAARDAGETESKFGTVFSSISEKANDVAANLAKSYGLSSSKSKQLLSDTGDLLSGFGFAQDEALAVSERVNKLAVDLASFTNYAGGAEGASAALTKALLGERESLKSLGIAISEKNVKEKVAKMVAEGHKFTSERQAKAQATLALAYEQSKNAVGDFARTSQDLANQERITSSRIQDLKESFGKLLLPVALKITRVIQKLASWMTELSPGTKKIIMIVGGLIAVLGPLLLAFGSIVLIAPAIAAGFAAIGTAVAVMTGPIGLIVAAIAAAVFLIIKNWDTLKPYFSGFFGFISGAFSFFSEIIMGVVGVISDVGGAIGGLVINIVGVISSISGAAGKMVADVVSAVSDAIETFKSLFALDFSAFIEKAKLAFTFDIPSISDIKAKFFGEEVKTPPPSRVDVGVNVGLDQGLKQTAPAAISANNVRRTDVGLATNG